MIGCAAAPTPIPTPQPTPTLRPSPTPTPTSEEVVYQDPAGDCLLIADNTPIVCDPVGIDILQVTITRGHPFTILLELARGGVADIPKYGLGYLLDLDRDPATGALNVLDLHGIGPELAVVYFDDGDTFQSVVVQFEPDGTQNRLDPSLAEWSVLDDNHIQVIISPELLDTQPFSIVGDLFESTIYDHFVDDGHILFPEGEVVVIK